MKTIFQILLLTYCVNTFGQKMSINRQDDYDYNISMDVVSRHPSYGLSFNTDDNEQIYLSVKSDSLYKNITSPALYAYIPVSINPVKVDLVIVFDDLSKLKIEQSKIGTEGYIEYQLNQNSLNKIKYKRVLDVQFTGIGKFSNNDNKDYFITFFSLLK